ncbi:MAG: outer membrane beta-barrel protein [Elusimicrobiaceae bacterium]|nr:outer membrane beta-barrel protein [Elusimicrobiaceae bacterium]
MKKLTAFVLVALFALPAFAARPVQFVVTEDITYDDNIYLKDKSYSKENPGYGEVQESFISTTRVGANYNGKVPGSDFALKAGALVGYNAYTEKPSKNNYWDALGNVELANENIKVGDSLVYTSDPANNELTDRYKRMRNTAYASLKTTNKKLFSVGVAVDDIFDRYFDAAMEGLNRNRFDASAQLFYNFNTKTNLFVEYTFSDIVYKVNQVNNSTGHRVGFGINGQVAPKVTGTAKVTYALRDYSHDIAGAENHPDLFGYYAALTWKATAQDTLRLSGERQMEETLYGTNRYFADTLIALYGQHKFNSKWAAGLTLGYEDMSYSRYVGNNKRHDNLYTIRPQLDYMFKDWLMGSLWYQYRGRHSNSQRFEYDNNRVGVSLKALF